MSRRIGRWRVAAAAVALLLVGACDPEAASTDPTAERPSEVSATDEPDEPDTVTLEPATTPSRSSRLVFVSNLKDGDSWVGSDGVEYRLGLVNAPERNEPCGSDARAFTSEYLDEGFTADVYSTDTYGRSVAEVLDADGNSLNVALAKSGYANDKYLAQFRHENPELARRLDAAFAAAPKRPCGTAAKPKPTKAPTQAQPLKPQAKNTCHTSYSPCLPVVADLNCPDIGHPVKVKGSDPYRLDRDGDGIGCD